MSQARHPIASRRSRVRMANRETGNKDQVHVSNRESGLGLSAKAKGPLAPGERAFRNLLSKAQYTRFFGLMYSISSVRV